VSRNQNRVGKRRLLVFADGEVCYHNAADLPEPDVSQSTLITFMDPSDDSTLERIAPAPDRTGVAQVHGSVHPLTLPLPPSPGSH
jgi:hypothetical protein